MRDSGPGDGSQAVAAGINDRGWVATSAALGGDRDGPTALCRRGIARDFGRLGGLNIGVQRPVQDNDGIGAQSAETAASDPFNAEAYGVDANLSSFGSRPAVGASAGRQAP